jgi:predicted metal-binding membrane protein
VWSSSPNSRDAASAPAKYRLPTSRSSIQAKCAALYAFLVEHWRGGDAALSALRLGIRHGLFCVGCCWTLMLLMLAVGSAHLAWMLALGALMTVERTTRWGRHVTKPAGAVLVMWAVLQLAGIGTPVSNAFFH